MIFIIATLDKNASRKIDLVTDDREVADNRLKYLRTVCGDTEAALLETRLATKADIYVPQIKKIA